MTPYSGQFSEKSATTGEGKPDDPIRPAHYDRHPSGVKAITVSQHEDFLIGNCFKYLFRRKFKGQELTDLKKAHFYLTLAIEKLESEQEHGRYPEF